MEMLLLRLGFWQLDRADEKQQQITLMQQAVVHKKARALAQLDPHSKQVQWVEGQLRFLTQPVILLDNQR
ncbi:MAG: SURF1 family protein, partial [Arenimonas sp.]|nr:SURF1 family protein [Arenimonas sp.]